MFYSAAFQVQGNPTTGQTTATLLARRWCPPGAASRPPRRSPVRLLDVHVRRILVHPQDLIIPAPSSQISCWHMARAVVRRTLQPPPRSVAPWPAIPPATGMQASRHRPHSGKRSCAGHFTCAGCSAEPMLRSGGSTTHTAARPPTPPVPPHLVLFTGLPPPPLGPPPGKPPSPKGKPAGVMPAGSQHPPTRPFKAAPHAAPAPAGRRRSNRWLIAHDKASHAPNGTASPTPCQRRVTRDAPPPKNMAAGCSGKAWQHPGVAVASRSGQGRLWCGRQAAFQNACCETVLRWMLETSTGGPPRS